METGRETHGNRRSYPRKGRSSTVRAVWDDSSRPIGPKVKKQVCNVKDLRPPRRAVPLRATAPGRTRGLKSRHIAVRSRGEVT
jgi:hypothetical protein